MNKVIFTGTIVSVDSQMQKNKAGVPYIGGAFVVVSTSVEEIMLPFLAFGAAMVHRISINGRPGMSVIIAGKLKKYAVRKDERPCEFFVEIQEIYFGDPVVDERELSRYVAEWKKEHGSRITVRGRTSLAIADEAMDVL